MQRRIFSLAAIGLFAASAVANPKWVETPLPPLVLEQPPTSGAIYRAGSYAALTEDSRARRVGDLLTVVLVERTQASKSASADTSRDSNTALTLPAAPPFSYVPGGLTSGGTTQSFKGSGSAAQANRLDGEITVTVAQLLPGGTLMVRGRKLIGLNRGEEFIELSGIIRPEDIGPDNRIASTRLADARIAYRGTGEIAAQSRQGWLARLFGSLSPF